MKEHAQYLRSNELDPYIRCGERNAANLDGQCHHPPVVTLAPYDLPFQGTGDERCFMHKPRACRYCDALTPWYDGSTCDYCDPFIDEDE